MGGCAVQLNELFLRDKRARVAAATSQQQQQSNQSQQQSSTTSNVTIDVVYVGDHPTNDVRACNQFSGIIYLKSMMNDDDSIFTYFRQLAGCLRHR